MRKIIFVLCLSFAILISNSAFSQKYHDGKAKKANPKWTVIHPEEESCTLLPSPNASRKETMWKVQNPAIIGNFNGVWMKDANEKYFVGERGQILHYRYGTWSLTVTDENITYRGVCGNGVDIYAVGLDTSANKGVITKYNSSLDLWEDQDDDNGLIKAGEDYYRIQRVPAGRADTLYVLGKTTTNDAYVLKFDGTTWTDITSIGTGPLPPNTLFRGLHVFDASNVYVAGNGGAVYLYDGTDWGIIDATGTTTENLNGIYAVDANNVHIVGDNQTWAKYNGTTWSLVDMPPEVDTNYHLSSIWYDAAGNYYATCVPDTDSDLPASVIKYNGTTAYLLAFDDETSFRDIHGLNINDFCVVGDDAKFLHHTSTGWLWMHRTYSDDLYSIWGLGKIAYAVGENGRILKYDGTRWSVMICPKQVDLECVWGTGENLVYAVGTGGTILKYDGVLWTEMNSTTTQGLYGIWGVGTTMWAVGANGTILKWSGTAWTAVISTEIPAIDLFGIHGTSATNVYVVGAPLYVTDTNTQERYKANGVFRFDGTKWTRINVSSNVEYEKDFPTTTLRGVWCGSPTDIYIVGDGIVDPDHSYNILYSNYTGWRYGALGFETVDGQPCHTDLFGVFWGITGTGGFVYGNQQQNGDDSFVQSKLYLIDDVGWVPEAKLLDNPLGGAELWALWGNAGKDVFVVGESGAIMHYEPAIIKNNFDQNGKSDIVVRNKKVGATNKGEVHVWYMNDTTIVKDTKLSEKHEGTYIGSGNFDGSLLKDHVWYTSGTRTVEADIWFHAETTKDDGIVNKQTASDVAINGTVIGVAHCNRDNKSDIVTQENNILRYWHMDGSRIVKTVFFDDPGYAFTVLGIGDFDTNSISDYVVSKVVRAETKYEIWYMDQDEVLARIEIPKPTTATTWEILGVGDFDGNDLSDILWRNKADGKVQIAFMWLGQQQPVYLALQTSPLATFKVAEIADFNGDGYDDILWLNGTALSMWKIKGQAVLAQAAIAFPAGYVAADWEVVSK